MIVIGGFILGALLGAYRARRLGGKPVDLAQYAFVYGLGFALLGLIVTLVIDRAV